MRSWITFHPRLKIGLINGVNEIALLKSGFFFNFILCRNKTNHSDKVRTLLCTTMNDLLRNHSFCLDATDLREVKFENICSWRCFHTNWLNTYLCERLGYIQSLSHNFPFISKFLFDAVFPSKKFFRFFFQLQNIVKIFVVYLKPYPQLSGLTFDLSLALTVHAQRLSHLSKMVAKTVS